VGSDIALKTLVSSFMPKYRYIYIYTYIKYNVSSALSSP
jgi:hypothetical protein